MHVAHALRAEVVWLTGMQSSEIRKTGLHIGDAVAQYAPKANTKTEKNGC